jgi:hypothetical protein
MGLISKSIFYASLCNDVAGLLVCNLFQLLSAFVLIPEGVHHVFEDCNARYVVMVN